MSAAELLEGLDLVAARWSEWMVARGVDGLLALAVVGVGCLLARRASPHLRAALLLLALVPLVAPVPPLPIGRSSAPSLRASLAELLVAPPALESASPFPADSAAKDATTALPAAGAPSSRPPSPWLWPWPTIAFLAWAAVVLALLARLVVNERAALRCLRRAPRLAPNELSFDVAALARVAGLRRPPRVVESAELSAPLTAGLLRPTLVLPRAARAALEPDELRFVVLHELAHLRRGDLWLGMLERLVRIAWFFHPAVWIVGRRLALERELACDDAALARFRHRDRHACAGAFLKVVELAGAPMPRLAAGLSRDSRHVRSRIMRMVAPRRVVTCRLSGRAWLALTASAAALLLLLQPARGVAQPRVQAARPTASAVEPAAGAPELPELPELIEALQLGAHWLVRHQDSAGFWDADGFDKLCKGTPCEGKGGALNDVGVTGLALLALIRSWERTGDAKVGGAIERADAYLGSVQDSQDGCFGPKAGQHFMYGHMMATLTLVELQAAAPADRRVGSIRRALQFITRARNPYKGWRYAFPPDGDNDGSVTSAAVVALGRALDAGFAVDATAVDDGLKLLDELTDDSTGRTGYHEAGSLSAREPEDMDLWPSEQTEAMTAAALHARAVHDVMLRTSARTLRGIDRLDARPPRWDIKSGSIDLVYWYHGTCALRAAGGSAWDRWRGAIAQELLPHQVRDGHAAGSFDPRVDPWGDNGGRVYSTAMALLTLAAALPD